MRRRAVLGGLLPVLVGSLPAVAEGWTALPISCFVVHCEPFIGGYGGTETWQITYGLILQGPDVLSVSYESESGEQLFAVVGHVYDFAESCRPFELWFRFLYAFDPTGARRRTVTEAIEEWPIHGG